MNTGSSQLAGLVVIIFEIFRFRILAGNTTTKRHHNPIITCCRVFWDDSQNNSPEFNQLATVHLFHGRTTHGGFNNLWRCTLDEGIHLFLNLFKKLVSSYHALRMKVYIFILNLFKRLISSYHALRITAVMAHHNVTKLSYSTQCPRGSRLPSRTQTISHKVDTLGQSIARLNKTHHTVIKITHHIVTKIAHHHVTLKITKCPSPWSV